MQNFQNTGHGCGGMCGGGMQKGNNDDERSYAGRSTRSKRSKKSRKKKKGKSKRKNYSSDEEESDDEDENSDDGEIISETVEYKNFGGCFDQNGNSTQKGGGQF
jgi:hypothetical protein